jgi:hypothetical protein
MDEEFGVDNLMQEESERRKQKVFIYQSISLRIIIFFISEICTKRSKWPSC